MVTDMKIAIEAARALTYETSRVCDIENNTNRILEGPRKLDPAEKKQRRQIAKSCKRLNSMLTPLAKYYASEMCVSVANLAVQVLGGSGYMQDYAAERYLRDARITTIYEGTSQLQIVAAVRRVTTGTLDAWVEPYERAEYDDADLNQMKQSLLDARNHLNEAIDFVKQRSATYMDLCGRRLVDAAAIIIIGHLLLDQAKSNERKQHVARRFLTSQLPLLDMSCRQVLSGDTSALDQYELLAGPVPSTA